jgi:hypothetical protein
MRTNQYPLVRLTVSQLGAHGARYAADAPTHVLGSLARQNLYPEWNDEQERDPRLEPPLLDRPHTEHEQDPENPDWQARVRALELGRNGNDRAIVQPSVQQRPGVRQQSLVRRAGPPKRHRSRRPYRWPCRGY